MNNLADDDENWDDRYGYIYFTADHKRWFARWVRVRITKGLWTQETLSSEVCAEIVAWYYERSRQYLRYRCGDHPGFDGSLTGEAVIVDEKRCVEDFPRALAETRAKVAEFDEDEEPRTAIPDGPIDVEAALQELAAPSKPAPKEGSASALVKKLGGEQAWQAFFDGRRRYERRRPRVCHTCGGEFIAGNATSAVTCHVCRAAKRKRCTKCGKVFTVKTGKDKRCTPCVEQAAAVGDVASAALLRRRQQRDETRGTR